MARARVFAAWTTRGWSTGPSRRYLCEPFASCLAPYPGSARGARTRFFPRDLGLPHVRNGSALGIALSSDFTTGAQFRGGSHRFASGLPMCLPPRSLPPIQHVVWRPWLLRPSTVEVVTFLHVGDASRPNQTIDGRGLSPLKIRSLVGCSQNARPQARERAGARHERRLFVPVACRPLLGAVLGEMLRRPPCYSALTLLPTSGAPRTPPAPLPNRRCCSGLKFLIFLWRSYILGNDCLPGREHLWSGTRSMQALADRAGIALEGGKRQ